MEKPNSINVIGWIFILFSILVIFCSFSGLIFLKIFTYQIARGVIEPVIVDFFRFMGPISGIFENFGIFAVIQILVFAYVIFVAVQFMRLKKWARDILEVISWLGILLSIVFGIMISITWDDVIRGISGVQGIPVATAFFDFLGMTIAISSVILHVVPLGIIIWFLRKEKVRRALVSPES